MSKGCLGDPAAACRRDPTCSLFVDLSGELTQLSYKFIERSKSEGKVSRVQVTGTGEMNARVLRGDRAMHAKTYF